MIVLYATGLLLRESEKTAVELVREIHLRGAELQTLIQEGGFMSLESLRDPYNALDRKINCMRMCKLVSKIYCSLFVCSVVTFCFQSAKAALSSIKKIDTAQLAKAAPSLPFSVRQFFSRILEALQQLWTLTASTRDRSMRTSSQANPARDILGVICRPTLLLSDLMDAAEGLAREGAEDFYVPNQDVLSQLQALANVKLAPTNITKTISVLQTWCGNVLTILKLKGEVAANNATPLILKAFYLRKLQHELQSALSTWLGRPRYLQAMQFIAELSNRKLTVKGCTSQSREIFEAIRSHYEKSSLEASFALSSCSSISMKWWWDAASGNEWSLVSKLIPYAIFEDSLTNLELLTEHVARRGPTFIFLEMVR